MSKPPPLTGAQVHEELLTSLVLQAKLDSSMLKLFGLLISGVPVTVELKEAFDAMNDKLQHVQLLLNKGTGAADGD